MRVLEIGPDEFPSIYRRALNGDLEWHTLDQYESPQLTYWTKEDHSFPVQSESYDITLSGQVIEHVRKPWRWIPELARVTRRGGLVITINPVSWGYHEAPIDCWRMFPEAMRALYEEAGLIVELCEWGSLETPQYRRFIPGVSREWQSRKRRIMYRMLGPLGSQLSGPMTRSQSAASLRRATPNEAVPPAL